MKHLFSHSWRVLALTVALFSTGVVPTLQADEQIFGNVRSSETLPAGKNDLYQFVTLRTGKDSGSYYAWDFDTEYEHGFTDQFTAGLSVVQHYFDIHGNDELDDSAEYQFGGIGVSGKYRVLSPFKDVVGLAVRLEGGYLLKDDVGGLEQKEWFINPELILHKNFLDDTLIIALNTGIEFAWGKKPAEEYAHEFSVEAALGVAYRFAPNWFVGIEGRVRSEYPRNDLANPEHAVVFAGPSLHYSAEKWWVTVSWGHQVYGWEVDEVVDRKAYAEEALDEFRVKVGLNF